MSIAVRQHAKGTSVITSPQTEAVTLSGDVTDLLVGVVWIGGATINTVTELGTGMTQIGATLQSGGTRLALFGKAAPTVGSGNIVATWSADPVDGANIFWLSIAGGDTSTGWRTVYDRDDTDGAGPGITVTDSQADDLCVHLAFVNTSSITFDGGETAIQEDNIRSNSFSAGLSYKVATGANTAMGCTDFGVYVEFATALIPGAGGPGTGADSLTLGETDTVQPISVTLSIQESG